MASLLPGTSSGQKKRRFLPGTSLFLPTSDVGGEIKHVYVCVLDNITNFLTTSALP